MTDDWYNIQADSKLIKQERAKARKLRASNWWKNIIAQEKCHFCEQKVAAKDLTMDHLVPIARGGKSTKGNIVPSCKSCNQSKKLETPVEAALKKIQED